MGTFCGGEIQEQESKELIPPTGTAHIECR